MSTTNNTDETFEFIYDTEARAMERLAEVTSKEETDNLTEMFYSPSVDNKKMAWGVLYGMNIDKQLREDVIAHFMANCDPVEHLQDMFVTLIEAKKQWETA